MKQVILCLCLYIAGCRSPLSDHGAMVKLIRLQGDKREIRVLQSKLKKDGCKFIKKINVGIPAHSKNNEKALELELKNRAAEVGGSGVMSTLEPVGKPPKLVIVGLVYVCPEGKGILEDI